MPRSGRFSRLREQLFCIVVALVPALGLAGPLAYVPNEKSGTVSVIDTATNQKIRDVAVGALPCGVVIR